MPLVHGDYLLLVDAVEKVVGKRLHINSIRRWYRRGVAGIRLNVLFMDGRFHTTVQDVERFLEAATAAKVARYADPPKLSVEQDISPLKCSEAVDAAVRKFNAMGPSRKRGRPPKASTTSSSALV
jgi:hypothetical protein